MMVDLTSHKVEIFTGINDVPVKPIATKAGNGAHLISKFNGLITDLQPALESISTTLSANLTYYVSPTGDDTNDGASTTTAFKSIEKAVNVASAIDLNGYGITIKLLDGTYETGARLRPYKSGGGGIVIEGNYNTPENVTISTLGQAFIAEGTGADYSFYGFRIAASRTIFECSHGASFTLGKLIISYSPHYQLNAHHRGSIYVKDDCVIESGASVHARAADYGLIEESRVVILLQNSPNYSSAYIEVERFGLVNLEYATYNGAATGKRFNASSASIIYTQSDDLNYIPGSIAGTVQSGALYIKANEVTL